MKRLKIIEEEISKLARDLSNLEEIWRNEKADVQGSTDVKEKIEKIKLEIEKLLAREIGREFQNSVW